MWVTGYWKSDFLSLSLTTIRLSHITWRSPFSLNNKFPFLHLSSLSFCVINIAITWTLKAVSETGSFYFFGTSSTSVPIIFTVQRGDFSPNCPQFRSLWQRERHAHTWAHLTAGPSSIMQRSGAVLYVQPQGSWEQPHSSPVQNVVRWKTADRCHLQPSVLLPTFDFRKRGFQIRT